MIVGSDDAASWCCTCCCCWADVGTRSQTPCTQHLCTCSQPLWHPHANFLAVLFTIVTSCIMVMSIASPYSKFMRMLCLLCFCFVYACVRAVIVFMCCSLLVVSAVLLLPCCHVVVVIRTFSLSLYFLFLPPSLFLPTSLLTYLPPYIPPSIIA